MDNNELINEMKRQSDENQPGSDIIHQLLKSAEELVGLELQIKDISQLLEKLTGRSNHLKTVVIPIKMQEVGISEFATPAGHHLKVEDFVAGSLPKDPVPRSVAIEEVTRLGGEGIIRNQITLAFERSQHNEAMSLASELRERGINAEVVSGIHPQTYLAFVRECLRNGTNVDPAKLGVHVGLKTKVTLA